MDIIMHLETINKVQHYIDEKDFEGLKKYIEIRKAEMLTLQEQNKSSDYIDNLVQNLD